MQPQRSDSASDYFSEMPHPNHQCPDQVQCPSSATDKIKGIPPRAMKLYVSDDVELKTQTLEITSIKGR